MNNDKNDPITRFICIKIIENYLLPTLSLLSAIFTLKSSRKVCQMTMYPRKIDQCNLPDSTTTFPFKIYLKTVPDNKKRSNISQKYPNNVDKLSIPLCVTVKYDSSAQVIPSLWVVVNIVTVLRHLWNSWRPK